MSSPFTQAMLHSRVDFLTKSSSRQEYRQTYLIMGKYKPTTDRKPVFKQQKLDEARIAEATANIKLQKQWAQMNTHFIMGI
jgi:hypothetical protein